MAHPREPDDGFLRETFTLPVEAARAKAFSAGSVERLRLGAVVDWTDEDEAQ